MLFVVIGSDNTLMLTNAVTATSVDLPIAERIAQGFGNIALHLFVSVIIELSMLWLAALSGLAAVRELCIFTAIAVLVDWELQMTVYLSTLTIDMQRFELADYFSQRGSALGGSSSEVKPKTPPKVYKNSLSVLRAAFCATVMERLARAALFSMARDASIFPAHAARSQRRRSFSTSATAAATSCRHFAPRTAIRCSRRTSTGCHRPTCCSGACSTLRMCRCCTSSSTRPSSSLFVHAHTPTCRPRCRH